MTKKNNSRAFQPILPHIHSALCVALCFLSAIVTSCADSQQKGAKTTIPTETYSTPTTSNSAVSPQAQPTESPDAKAGNMNVSPTTDSYDDGMLDGEAAAEEDRLAGRPGMQVGGDEEDDEDYDDGYDDGYEE